MKSLKAWFVLLALAVAGSACNGGDDDDATTSAPPFVVSVGEYYTISGTSTIQQGECWGVSFTAAAGTFDEGSEIQLTNADNSELFAGIFTHVDAGGDLPVLQVSADGSELFMGFGALTGYPCVAWFPTSFDVDTYGFVVRDGAREDNLPSVITFTALPAGTNLGTGEATLSDSLPNANNFDVYSFTAGGGGATLGILATLSSASNMIPDVAVYTTSSGNPVSAAGFGFQATMFPRSGVSPANLKTIVRSTEPGTGAGFNYTLVLASAGTPIASPALAEDCAGATVNLASAPGVYYVKPDVSALANTYNPAGAIGCTDALIIPPTATSGVNSPGRDGVYKLNLPIGATLLAGGNGAVTGNSGRDIALLLYADCSVQTTCLAAADIYGPSPSATSFRTDSLRYKNTTGATQDVYLVVDDYGDGTTGLGTGTGAYDLFVIIQP